MSLYSVPFTSVNFLLSFITYSVVMVTIILFTEACNYLFVYEYVVDIELKTDTWGAIKRGVTTKSLNVDEEDDDDNGKHKKKKNMNRTLLLGGRKDGYICVYDWETGKVDFKIDVSIMSSTF